MDRTTEFFGYIKNSQSIELVDDKVKDGKFSLLLAKKAHKTSKSDWSAFTDGLKKLVKNITRMKNFLLANRKDYVNLYSHLISKASKMTDQERDQIDYDVHVFMKNCTDLIRNYRNEINIKSSSSKCGVQAKDHYTLVLNLIESYLKSVCDLYTQQKAIRIKRACERQRLFRLAASVSHSRPLFPVSSTSSDSSMGDSRESIQVGSKSTDTTSRSHILADNSSQVSGFVTHSTEEHEELSPQEIQLFDQENSQLYDDLNSVTDEVKVIGGKVMEIARLQEIFTENVLQQEDQLDRLNTTVVSATESVRDGNEQLREAIKKGAGFRVWVLFFIIMLAFTVLFLDWYNP
jgi:syntaxin 18